MPVFLKNRLRMPLHDSPLGYVFLSIALNSFSVRPAASSELSHSCRRCVQVVFEWYVCVCVCLVRVCVCVCVHRACVCLISMSVRCVRMWSDYVSV